MKKNISIFSIVGLTIPLVYATASDLPYITPQQAVDLAVTPRLQVKQIVHNSTPAEIVGLNKSFNHIHKIHQQILGDKAPIINDDILQAPDTAEALEAKINAIMQNTAQPEDFIHLMAPPSAEDILSEKTTNEILNTENTLTSDTTEQQKPQSGTLKDIIVEEDDDSTKHIYRRKVFIKQ